MPVAGCRLPVAGCRLPRLEQQRLDAVRAYDALVRRPDEDREAPVLRGDQRDAVLLIVHELGSRQVSRPAEMGGIHRPRDAADDGFGHLHVLVERLPRQPADDLGVPDLVALVTGPVVVFDHLKRSLTIVAPSAAVNPAIASTACREAS